MVDPSLIRIVETPEWELDDAAEEPVAAPGLQVFPLAARVTWHGERLEPLEVLVAGLDGATTAPLVAPAPPRGERAKRPLVGRMQRITGQGPGRP
jgi:hypothetical protein